MTNSLTGRIIIIAEQGHGIEAMLADEPSEGRWMFANLGDPHLVPTRE